MRAIVSEVQVWFRIFLVLRLGWVALKWNLKSSKKHLRNSWWKKYLGALDWTRKT